MTGHSLSKICGTFLSSVLLGLVIKGLSTFSTSSASAQDASERLGLSKTALAQGAQSDASARESRLRSIEEELLKKLSLEDTTQSEKGGSPTNTELERPTTKKITPPTASDPETVNETHSGQQNAAIQAETFKKVPHSRTAFSTTRQPRRIVHSTIQPTPTRSEVSYERKDQYQRGRTANDLEYRLAIAESQVALLTKEVETTKNALARSETRAAELSKLLADGPSPTAPRMVESENVETDTYAFNGPGGVTSTSPSPAVPNARVVKSRTNLRTGPSARESSIAHLDRDSIVTIERRNGGWYRIISADGTRGWVSGASLLFDEGNFPTSTVRVVGYRPEREPTGIRY
jgi:hypothetical protein